MVATVHPIEIDDENTPQQIKSETESVLSDGQSSAYNAKSIKFCLIILISGLVILSVVVLSATWLASFGPAITKSSDAERDSELRSIINYIETTFKELVMSSVNIKQQLVGDGINPYDERITGQKTFSGYKSVKKNHDGMIVSSYVGDPYNYCFGTINWGSGSALFNITTVDQKIYYCNDWENTTFCNSSSTPNEIASSFDLSLLIAQCKDTPTALSYTPSYADPAMPQYVFISLVNCVANPITHKFWYYYGNDMTTGSISDFLRRKVETLDGSKSFIVETSTNALIAVDNSASISKWGSDGSLVRETAFTVADSNINSIATTTRNLHQNWKDFECNKIEVTTSTTDYISVYRLCTDTKIDWIIVLSIPQWKYIGSTVIAVVTSMIGSLVIVGIGILMGIVVSLKIVKPFKNLMDLFESVANMDLDGIEVIPSYFSEVKTLQKHFVHMVKQIKLYRSFIPAHILSQLDSGQEENNAQQEGKAQSSQVSRTSSERHSMESGHSKESRIGAHQSSNGHSSRKRYTKDINRFALYLEKKTFTVIQLRIKGLNELLENIDHESITKILSEIFEAINLSSKLYGVHVSGLENDNVFISINASSNQTNHEEKAATLARALEERLLKLKYSKWKNMEAFNKKPFVLDDLNFVMAIHSVQSHVGNIGTNESKAFTILGSGKKNLSEMVDLADEIGISVVCSDAIKEKIDVSFQTRFLDFQLFVNDSLVMSSQNRNSDGQEMNTKKGHVYELGVSNHVQDDEWLYELQEKEKKQKWTLYNQGVGHFLDGDFEMALEKFSQQVVKDPNDRAALRMLEKCKDVGNELEIIN